VKVSLNWLKRYIDLEESPKEIADSLTLLGFEVDDIETSGAPALEKVVVGEVLQRERHPNADKLGVCRVDCGFELGERSIVCGATNFTVGDRVPVALPGAELPGGFKIKRSKLRGVDSDGMMCSGKEIGVGEDHAGLLILDGRPELGKPINEVLSKGDVVFNLEVTPNRPDCLSHFGIARELSAWYRRELKYPEAGKLPGAGSGSSVFGGVCVEAAEDCHLYTARVIRGVRIGPSPEWLKEALSSIGLRSTNNVVDVTNFVMHELGNPMHAFDARDIEGGRIVVRHAAEGERMITLDGQERVLSSRMPVIADECKALAVAGVMGGQNSEIKDDTSDIVLEVASFRASAIRWVAKSLGLSTDSSYRFERGVDPLSLRAASDRAASLIAELSGGAVCEELHVVGSEQRAATEIALSPDWVRKKSGFEITDAEIREALELLNLTVSSASATAWTVAVPSYRSDLVRPVDLLEEALRLYGTHRIPGGPVRATATSACDSPITEFNRGASALLAGQGFSEAVNYTLRSAQEQASWGQGTDADSLALLNPISEDQTQLRDGLLPGLLEVLRLNQSRKTGAYRFFETGRVFRTINGRLMEMVSVAFIECNAGTARTWKPRAYEDFYSVKKRVAELAALAGLDLQKFRIRGAEESDQAWQPGHGALYEEPKAGFFCELGLMNLERVKKMDISGEVLAGQFCYLPERLRRGKRIGFRPFSLYPASVRDLALLVGADVLAADVLKAVSKIASKAAKGFEVEAVELFDLYQGKGLPEGKKSLAISMTFRSAERTLKDKEVNQAFEAIQLQIKGSTDYTIRD